MLKIIAILIIVEWVLLILVTLGFMIFNIIDLIEDIIRCYKVPDFSKSFDYLLKMPIDGETDDKTTKTRLCK